MIKTSHAGIVLVLILGACQGPGQPQVSRFDTPDLTLTRAGGPPDAAPGTCWGMDQTPAIIETVTERILLQPAQTNSEGAVLAAPVYRPESTQRIIEDRREIWFETPCPDVLTEERIAALQRALAVRGLYTGDVTGHMDRATRRAVRTYQKPQGLNSDILSRAAAERLGLVSAAEFEAARQARIVAQASTVPPSPPEN